MNGQLMPVDWRDDPWPLHDIAKSRSIEATALQAHPPHRLMQRAGDAVARLAQAVAPHARRVTVLVGPGNNGGDGLVAALALHRAGRQVQALLHSDPAALGGDAAWAHGEAAAAAVPMHAADSQGAMLEADLIIDALLGLGNSRALDGAMAASVARINRGDRRGPSATKVLAIDLPSGLPADTGHPAGPAVRADHTLSLLTLKPGLFAGMGRELSGRVWLDSLGVDVSAVPPSAWLPGAGSLLDVARWRGHTGHKGRFGDVCVVGGGAGMVGAAWLAARAALEAGAGRVFCSPLDEQAALLWPPQPELMGRPRLWMQDPAVLKAQTVVCGCGGGAQVARALPALLAHAGRLVLDADALNALARDGCLQASLRQRADRGLPTVLTPHPLEAARLLGCSSAEVQADRLHAGAELAARLAAIVVLKGAGTLITGAAGPPWINTSGNAALATAGSGDVLAGWIGGLWSAASGVEGAQATGLPLRAAMTSVWQHGRAADLHRASGATGPLTASALIDAMRAV